MMIKILINVIEVLCLAWVLFAMGIFMFALIKWLHYELHRFDEEDEPFVYVYDRKTGMIKMEPKNEKDN